jgi:hypothetical protein
MESDRLNKGPVGSGDYVVRQGDCISKIAADAGFFWQTIWDHPRNQELKAARQDPNILLPGDRVYIPDKRLRAEAKPADQRHRFVLKGVPAMLRVKVEKLGQARANESYILNIDGKVTRGNLDSQGYLKVSISPNARQGVLEVGSDRQRFEFELGGVDPIDEVTGIQVRLNNLGYGAGEPDGVLNAVTRMAIETFQKDCQLPATGEPDETTLQKLREAHGS